MGLDKKKFLTFSFLAILFVALMAAWLGFGERGFIHLYHMEREREASLAKIEMLKKENKKLIEEIERLRNDTEYIETLGRRELGLVREDEILYQFLDPEKKARLSQGNEGKQP